MSVQDPNRGTIQASDVDNPASALSYEVIFGPQFGKLSTFDPLTGAWAYTHTANNGLDDAFVVRVSDGQGGVTLQKVGLSNPVPGPVVPEWYAPVVLDLDGNGFSLIAAADSTALFDFTGDGVPDHTGWTSGADGLLAFDINNDGVISRGDEISFKGYVTGAQTDLQGLAAFDTNHDDALSAADAQWDRLYVWQDLNEDGVQTPDELTTVAQRGVAAISLVSDNVASSNAGNTIHGIGSYTRTDGTTGQLADVAFALADTTDPALDVTAQAEGGEVSTGSGNDSIHGGEGVDRIHAGAGNDRVAAAGGDDRVFGEDGVDLIDAGAGNDTVRGGAGNDAVAAGPGKDVVHGDEGDDRLFGGDGNDRLHGNDGNDSLSGDAGDDSLQGGAGQDWLIGGDGDDTYVFESSDQAADASVMPDWISDSAGCDVVRLDDDMAWTDVSASLAANGAIALDWKTGAVLIDGGPDAGTRMWVEIDDERQSLDGVLNHEAAPSRNEAHGNEDAEQETHQDLPQPRKSPAPDGNGAGSPGHTAAGASEDGGRLFSDQAPRESKVRDDSLTSKSIGESIASAKASFEQGLQRQRSVEDAGRAISQSEFTGRQAMPLLWNLHDALLDAQLARSDGGFVGTASLTEPLGIELTGGLSGVNGASGRLDSVARAEQVQKFDLMHFN